MLTKGLDVIEPIKNKLTKEELIARVLMENIHEGSFFFCEEDCLWYVYRNGEAVVLSIGKE